MLGTHDVVMVATALERNRMVSMGVESELSDKQDSIQDSDRNTWQ